MNRKERFIEIMNSIKVGSKIKYLTNYDDLTDTPPYYRSGKEYKVIEDTVTDITKCSCDLSHEGCKFCIGNIVVKYSSGCFKKRGSFQCQIISVDNDSIDFINENEFLL